MAITSTQITDYLYKKVGFGVTKTDTSTAKYPFNESIASPLLVPGATVLQQDFAIPNVASAPSANTVLNGSTIVSVYNTSTSAVVQGTSLSESVTNETWSTGITNWIPPSFGSGYQLKIYAGPPGASAATAATYTQLPVAGSGNSDSWFFDYQSGILNFADTNVPTAAANVSNVVYFMGAVYTGTLGVTNYANLNVTGNLTSINGNLVLTNGNIYAQNYYGTFQGTIGSSTSIGLANVAYYDQITPLTTNQTFYLEFSNTASAGNSITGVVSTVNVNPSTSTINAVAFAGTSGTFTGVVTSNAVNAATIGNTGATFTGSSLNVSTVNATTSVTTNTLNAATIGNTSAAFTGASLSLTGADNNGTQYTSGALQISGGAGISGNLYVQGTVYAGNLISTTTQILEVTDPLLYLNANTPSNYNYEIGFYSHFGAYGVNYQHTGFVRDHNVGIWKLFANVVEPAGGTVNFNNAIWETLQIGNLIVANSSAATSTTTGALTIAGGAGIQGSLWAGNYYTTGSLYAPTVVAGTVNAATIGNTGAAVSGASGTFTGVVTSNALNAVTIGNAGSALSGTSGTFTGVVTAGTVNAATIGNTNSALSGATATLTGLVTAGTVNAATIGNVGAAINSATLNASTSITTNTLNAATIGNTGAAIIGATVNATTSVTTNTLNAATIGNTGASITGATVNATTSVTTATVNATTSVTTGTLNAATIGNTGATLIGTLSASNIAGTVATANVAIYANVLALSNNATFYPLLGNVTAGNTTTGTSTSLSYNPSTGNLSATAFIGNGQYLTNINPGAIGTVTVANVAYFVNETATTTNATFYPILGNTNAANGNSAAFTNSSLSYNPSSGQLSASSFSGAISSSMVTTALGYTPYNSTNPAGYQTSSGSVNSATYATQASTVAINAATTSSVYYPIFVPSNTTTAQYEYVDGNNYLQYNPGTGNLATKVLTATSNVFIGTPLNYTPANAPVQVGYNINNYSQFSIQNANNGNNASTDIAAVANNGSDNDTYVDMGIVSSTYNQAAYSLYKPNDGYLIVAGNTTTGGGNLILNTYQANDIVFATGGTTAKFEVARITSGNTVVVKSTNNNTLSANTGAFQLWGGASISGNAYIGGSSYHMGGALFNHNQASAGTTGGANQNAFIMQGVNDSTLIYAKPLSAYDAVIIGGNAASTSFAQGAKLVVNSTDSMLLPVGSSAQRPGSTGGTDTTGMMRYSTTQGAIEWYNGTTWATASTSFTVITDQQFTGTGSQTAFTLTNATTTAGTIVSINGVIQIPTLAYSVFTGNSQLIFTEAPLTTDVIDVRTLTTTQTVNQLYDTSGYNTVNTITGTGITFTTGTTQSTTQYTINTSGAIASSVANVTIASAATPTTVDSFFGNTYSTAKYILSSTYNGVKEAAEALVVSNGATSNIVVYGTINTAGNTLTTWSTTMSGNVVNLVGTTTNAGTVIRMTKQYNAV